jgi:hypothetical protein
MEQRIAGGVGSGSEETSFRKWMNESSASDSSNRCENRERGSLLVEEKRETILGCTVFANIDRGSKCYSTATWKYCKMKSLICR